MEQAPSDDFTNFAPSHDNKLLSHTSSLAVSHDKRRLIKNNSMQKLTTVHRRLISFASHVVQLF